MEASKVISLDLETNGVDFRHGARPFIVTICEWDNEKSCPNEPILWKWAVDHLTRKLYIPEDDIVVIQTVIDEADIIVGQNFKFDAHGLSTIGVDIPWDKVRDTLLAGHLLASNHKHNLTDMCIEYLGEDIEPYELAVKKVVVEARKIVKREFPDWRIADEGLEDMPSIRSSGTRDEDKPWKNDMWLPSALAAHQVETGFIDEVCYRDDPDRQAVIDYANADSISTLCLWFRMEQEIKRRGLWEIYLERLKLLPIAYEIEEYGITVIKSNTEEMAESCEISIAQARDTCESIAKKYGHSLEMPAGSGVNDSLREMFFGSCRLVCPRCGGGGRVKEWNGNGRIKDGDVKCPKCAKKSVKVGCQVLRNPCFNADRIYAAKSTSATPTLDKSALDHYEATMDGDKLEFVKALRDMRGWAKASESLETYKRFWLPTDDPDYYHLYPHVNPTGSDHLRWSSYNPNGQNISKREGFSLRRCFGPAPGREWWSMDFQNIELRIPGYESGEEAMIELFESPDDPPYFGSYHLLVASLIYPELFHPISGEKGVFKERYKATYYQWTKNFNFAEQYGCGEKKGDATARREGAWKTVRNKLPKRTALAAKYLKMAEELGYVETLPDKTVNPKRGYPILASRMENGRVSPTTPFNYHVSGSAMQCTNKAMIRCQARIKRWNAEGWDGRLAFQWHDELLFDMPVGETEDANIEKALQLKELMELSGQDIGIPTPVSVELHRETWAEGIALVDMLENAKVGSLP